MANDTKRGRRTQVYICPTPREFCSGKKTIDTKKAPRYGYHSSSHECLVCTGNWLVKTGYTRLSPRAYQAPDDGPIRILEKKAIRAKPGKGDRYMSGPRAKILGV